MQNIKNKMQIEHSKSLITKDRLAVKDNLLDLFCMSNFSALRLKAEKSWQLFITLQLTIAEILQIDW